MHKIIDNRSKNINWDRVDFLSNIAVKGLAKIITVIGLSWAVFWLLAKTFGGV